MLFPIIKGQNLNFQKFSIPDGLQGVINLIILPFQIWQQEEVDSWAPSLTKIEAMHSKFRFYEVPTLDEVYRPRQNFIDGGMRQGIPDNATRERTITVYLNKNTLRKQLDIPSEETIQLYLVTRKQEIIWKNHGYFSPEAEISLKLSLEEFLEKDQKKII